jgi:hypothetical protein
MPICFESYYKEYDRQGWAQKVNNEANKPDGFKVITLDYIDPAQNQPKLISRYPKYFHIIGEIILQEVL